MIRKILSELCAVVGAFLSLIAAAIMIAAVLTEPIERTIVIMNRSAICGMIAIVLLVTANLIAPE